VGRTGSSLSLTLFPFNSDPSSLRIALARSSADSKSTTL
jgi:hypothetical protein